MSLSPEPVELESPVTPVRRVKKDRPLRMLVIQFFAVMLCALIAIYAFGFIVGLLGLRMPFIDSDSLGNQVNSLTGEESEPHQWNELEKTNEKG